MNQLRHALSTGLCMAALGVALTGGISPHEAEACPPDTLEVLELKVPESPAPLNASIYYKWIGFESYVANYILTGPALRVTKVGDETPLNVVTDTYSNYEIRHEWVTPEALEPNTSYLVQAFHDYEMTQLFDEALFTTGAQVDSTAPESLGRVKVGRDHIEGDPEAEGCDWWSETWILADLEAPETVGGDLYELHVSRDAGFEAAIRLLDSDGDIRADIYEQRQWSPEETLYARVRAIDFAGNPGPWSTTTVRDEPLYCTISDNGPEGILSLMVMALAGALGGRRRRQP